MNIALKQGKVESSEGWSASLDLVAAQRSGRTVLSRNRHYGPLRVQRPFYPEGGVCHVYVLHPPGGLVAGDELDIRVHGESGSQLLLTTPSAGRVYCTNTQHLEQRQKVSIRVDAGARCEWLPQESIVFDRAEAVNRLNVSLAESAEFTGWEITCLGRPASDEAFNGGHLQQSWEIYREDRPLLLERTKFVGGSAQLKARWGLAGASVVGTLVTTCLDIPVEKTREVIDRVTVRREQYLNRADALPFDVPMVAVTALPELLVMRAFGQNAADVKAVFMELWQHLRRAQTGEDAVAPRIWAT
jgi:urease accessory protein